MMSVCVVPLPQAISYQLAIISSDLNFASFPYGPPTGETNEARVITCGELYAQPFSGNKPAGDWVKLYFMLRPRELLFLERGDQLKGRLFIEGAVVKSKDDDLVSAVLCSIERCKDNTHKGK